jgi:hypothetical protein
MYTAEENEFPPAIPQRLSPIPDTIANDDCRRFIFLAQRCHRVDCVVDTDRRCRRRIAELLAVCCLVARSRRLLLGLEVVEQDAALLGLLTPVLDNNARAVDNLAGVALAVDLACNSKTIRKLGLMWT